MSVVGGELPAGSELTSYDVVGGRLAAVSLRPVGARGTALLVPGFTGSKEDFSPVLEGIAAGGWHAVALDQRGQHESPGPDDLAAYSVESLAADLRQVIARLDGPAHLVGHSFGGLVCRAAAIAEPTAVASLVLMSSGPAALSGPRVEAMDHVRPLVEAGDLVAVADLMDAAAALDPLRQELPGEIRDFLRRRFLTSSAAGLLGMGDALTSEPDRVDELAALDLPVLVLYGEHDDAWPPAVQAAMAERLGAAHIVVPGSRHSPAAERPDATVAALLAFWG